jgi:hypothetical protein
MSLLAVQGGATGTGTVTLLAPVTNTNRTLTLPDETGTLITAASIPANTYIGGRGQVFTTTGDFTVPAGITAVKVTVVGGGGNGGSVTGLNSGGGGGGGGGVAIEFVTGLTPGGTVTVTVGSAAGTSSFGAYCSATGGATAATVTANTTAGAGGAGGAGSGGDINGTGGAGAAATRNTTNGAIDSGSGGGSSGQPAYQATQFTITCSSVIIPGFVGSGFLTGAGGQGIANAGGNGVAATGFGNGGGGAHANSATDRTGGAGSGGIVIVEF